MNRDDLNQTIDAIKAMKDRALLKYDEIIEFELRRRGLIKEALAEYLKIYPVFFERVEKQESEINYLNLSKIEFEMGYIQFLLCNFEESVKHFYHSSESALKGDDPTGGEIGNFRVIHTQYVGGMLTADIAREKMLKSKDVFYTMAHNFDKKREDDKTFETKATKCRNWVFNIEGRLFDISINEGNVNEAESYYESFISDESTTRLLSLTPPDPERSVLKLRKDGRLSYIKNNFKESLGFFAQYLNASLSEFGDPNTDWVKHASEMQEIARDYLFAGKALLALGEKVKAKEVFETGMSFNADDGNCTFQIEIKQILSSDF